MKNTKVILYQWATEYPEEYIDIDWPAVHKEVGADAIDWIHKQEHKDVQLSLEFIPRGRRLIAEFFNIKIYEMYTHKFAK